MITVYGIKNCDTVKKALKWLDGNDVAYQFHDYKKSGVDEAWLRKVVLKFGWELVLNKRGTTWRKLGDEQSKIIDNEAAILLMIEMTSIIKRPIIDLGGDYLVGFNEGKYEEAFR